MMPLPVVTTELQIVIISDLHAYERGSQSTAPSHLCTANSSGNSRTHPITALEDLIHREGIRGDLLICPGDLADKAHPGALQFAWHLAQQVKTAVQAPYLIATTGNHDLDSRYNYDGHDSKGLLQNLRPSYPFPDDAEHINLTYWAKNFVIVDGDSYRILVLNSSAFHGGAPGEIDKGRVSEYTLAAIQAQLLNAAPKPVNILVCHHHPQQHMELKLGEYDVMANGQLLLDMLGNAQVGGWLVVHGHKHHPKISYAAGGATSPVVLSAGSLSAILYPELATAARNQFHVVTLPFGQYHAFGFVGRVKSWEWAFGTGWIPATPGSGLPFACGFGDRGDPELLAAKIAEHFVRPKMTWREFEEAFPQVNYLLPQDWGALVKILDRKHNLRVQPPEGIPVEIGEGS